MHTDNIMKLDIKLLVSFVTIMEEGSVSRAADRLNVTQPALSKSLQRLRTLFNDPLFTRQAYGLSPTSKAKELHDQIQPIINSLTELMKPSELNLKTLNRRFRVRVNEGDLETFVEPLLATIHYEAPEVKLSILNWGDSNFEELISGQCDLGVVSVNDTPNHIRSKLVGYIESCIVISESHPLYHKAEITLDEFLSYKVVTQHFRNIEHASAHTIKQRLRQKGYDIEPKLEAESLMVTLQAVKRGMALVTSRSIGDLFCSITECKEGFHPVKVLPIPKEAVELDPYNGLHPIHICWHERYNNDAAHRWLRNKIIDFMRASPWVLSEPKTKSDV
ncbi:LysR family transcriptional regulator [Marinomonas mediterranea]|jgi:Transcriptional regulator|uniref:Transcriptional regulator, LysR family n=1 Tax=Marinomonas mediterranea (strain ATCC 700492 / JCM 21426 / NBRC 103028 / MMB-1) TaxID=717774 RepID=F2JTP0_MARM1|nr:LysR family transcriptional regulator [Marinomonas mediterranea]ADZ92660.1 transcriptional regulator, LysR family [Marinomonas mediterranea MMB-1]WCN10597.1 LysR family transcriptional regulator [Marinomonas mediterranea]WCN14648.1 LysR family transcriptional regulator [Marinomonas mediterranea]WCN18693.1 LysR family transcriptional regulator [Marinomonas mediterranea MMB-1]